MLKSVEIDIGGQKVDKHFDAFYEVMDELEVPSEKRAGLTRCWAGTTSWTPRPRGACEPERAADLLRAPEVLVEQAAGPACPCSRSCTTTCASTSSSAAPWSWSKSDVAADPAHERGRPPELRGRVPVGRLCLLRCG